MARPIKPTDEDVGAAMMAWYADAIKEYPDGLISQAQASANDGRPKAHTGQDIAVTKGTPVYAAADGIVKAAFTVSDWKGCVTIEHSYSQNSEIRKYTTSYWHIDYSVGVGTVVKKGQQIGKVADLGSNSHLHFGLRTAPYSNVANRGALPRAKSDGPDDPVFTEWFRRPL
jgi:murein DD-endopeptidase MepM/ murein hydrolase activator NlpD